MAKVSRRRCFGFNVICKANAVLNMPWCAKCEKRRRDHITKQLERMSADMKDRHARP